MGGRREGGRKRRMGKGEEGAVRRRGTRPLVPVKPRRPSATETQEGHPRSHDDWKKAKHVCF